jgi:hypothetical protein
MVNIYVLNKDGLPLMPIHSYRRAKKLLKSKRAHVVNKNPFTIRMNEQLNNPVVDDCLLGIDPGRTNIGLCVIDRYGNILFASDVVTRNKEIHRLMRERKLSRQASRRGERKARQRRAIRSDKTGLARATEFWRMLPGCKKPIRCKVIKNSHARFLHRKRPKGWLTPTANHLLQTHINAVNKVLSFLPVSTIVIEVNRFDFARMENPGIKNWEYQQGKLAGYNSVEEAVFIQQKGKCLLCKKKIHSYHHIIPVSQGGSESIENRAGLCYEHHYGEQGVHKSSITQGRLEKKKKGVLKKYHALSTINQIMSYLLENLNKIRPVLVTAGYETQRIRQSFSSLPIKEKDDGTHYIDAWCIAISALDEIKGFPDFENSFYTIVQFRRHDRAIIYAQHERTYYYNGKAVAHNRHKRTGQANTKKKWDSLAEFRSQHPQLVSKLTVKKSTRSYSNTKRALPGAIYEYKNKRYILKGQKDNGTKWCGYGEKEYIPSKDCTVIKKNSGLVFV